MAMNGTTRPNDPLLVIACGTTYGAMLRPALHRELLERVGEAPPWYSEIILDTDRTVMSPGLLTGPALRTVHIGNVNLKELAARPLRNPEVAAVLRDINPERLPTTLISGSEKLPAFTLAAMLDRWLDQDGPWEVLRERIAALQAYAAAVGSSRYSVVVIGLIAGGVGSIAPLVMAAAVRTLSSFDSALKRHLELTAILIDADPHELDRSRIAANAAACLALIKRGQLGKFKIQVPGRRPYDFIGGRRLFDHIMLVSPSTATGRIEREEFRGALARLTLHWTSDELTEAIRAKLVEFHPGPIESTDPQEVAR